MEYNEILFCDVWRNIVTALKEIKSLILSTELLPEYRWDLYEGGLRESEEWISHIYKKVPLSNAHDNDTAYDECQYLCYIDRYPCNGYVYDNPNCYLTAWHVNSTEFQGDFTAGDSKIFMYIKRKDS